MRSTFTGLAAWLKNSFIDFPRTASTVLFFSGCNLRCPYCHNPDFITAPSNQSGLSDQIWDFLEKRKGILDGVVFSGGEPTLQRGLTDWMLDARALGYKVKLDTNGLLPEKIRECCPDYLALDVKTTPRHYSDFLKASYTDIEKRLTASIAIVKSMGVCAEIRITVAPTITTEKIIHRLLPLLEGAAMVFLQPVSFKNGILDAGFFGETQKIPEEEIRKYQKMMASVVGKCSIRDE
jgi:pyruvate formate lyase activating enzyme